MMQNRIVFFLNPIKNLIWATRKSMLVPKYMNTIFNGLKSLTFDLGLLICCIAILSGCDKELPVEVKQVIPKPVVQEAKPANFIVCIDNSASIRGQERIIILETTMLLADLAEQGDRISVVTFGQEARLTASSIINTDQDRISFKRQVEKGVNFKENYSDIRAGIKYLLDNEKETIGVKGFDPHIIILSDGKLEPKDRKTQDAFDEMKALRDGKLSNLNFYAVVLGDRYCNDLIPAKDDGLQLDGKTLMKNIIATSSNHFFHAQRMDQLFSAAVTILSKAKGISSIGDQAQTNEFRIDASVESMTFIVRKCKNDGTILCKSADILLNAPEDTPKRESESIYRSSDYKYFDLILVRNPREGMWSVSLSNGNEANVLSKIVTPLELQFQNKSTYYINESAVLNAWVFDKKQLKSISDENYRIKARIAPKGKLNASNVYIDFNLDAENNQHYIEVPAQIFAGMNMSEKPVELSMELIVQRINKDSSDVDPWFIRRSSPIRINITQPFIKWNMQKPESIKIPFREEMVTLGATADPVAINSIYMVQPTLKVNFDHFDKDLKVYQPVKNMEIENPLDGTLKDSHLIFEKLIQISELVSGSYRYSYQLKGTLKKGGTFTIDSPQYYFSLKSYSFDSWEFWVCVGVLLFLVLCVLSSATAKMQGSLTTDSSSQIINAKVYQSEANHENRFTLKAQKLFLIKSNIILTVMTGFINVDGQVMSQGQKVKLYPRMIHTIQHSEGGKQIERQLMVNV
ncbi:MAG: vWA domain-containing protein [Pseudomonadota bacterium]